SLSNEWSESKFGIVADDWFSRSPAEVCKWNKITKRLYTIARWNRCALLRERAISDLKSTPCLARNILSYLQGFRLTKEELSELLELVGDGANTERRILISKFL